MLICSTKPTQYDPDKKYRVGEHVNLSILVPGLLANPSQAVAVGLVRADLNTCALRGTNSFLHLKRIGVKFRKFKRNVNLRFA